MKWFFMVCVLVDVSADQCQFGYVLQRPHDTPQACEETAAEFAEDNPHIPEHALSCEPVQIEEGLEA